MFMLQNSFKITKKLCHNNNNNNNKIIVVRLLSAVPESKPKCPEIHNNKQESAQVDEFKNALPYSQIPGPIKLPIIGAAHCFMPGGLLYKKNLYDMHIAIREKYGDIVALRGLFDKPDIVFCFDPDDFEKVFRTEGQWPIRRSFETFVYFRRNFRLDIFKDGGGLLAEHGEAWQKIRSKVNAVMLQPKIVRTYVKPVDDVTKDFINRIKTIRDEKNEVPANFGSEVNKWSFEAMGCIALDARLKVFDDASENSKSQLFIETVQKFLDLSFELEIGPSLWKYYKTPKFNEMMKTLDLLTTLTMSYIETSIEKMETSKSNDPNHEPSVVEKLLKIDRNTAIVMALDMLSAGIDTTSAATLTLLILIATNPEKQEILRQEIFKYLPNDDSELNGEILLNMRYLKACLKEAARITPVIAGNMRTTQQDIVIKGYLIPKGKDVAMGNMVLQNDERHYKRCKEFLPERWLKNVETVDVEPSKNTHPFVYMPFGFGARSCIGRRFAELEQEILMIRILKNFKVEWHYPQMVYGDRFLNTPKGDLKFRFIDLK